MSLDKLKDKVLVDPSTGCWVWQKSTREGYGQIMVDSVPWLAHRYAYTVAYGNIPEGLLVRHKCHNRKCCNPEHLHVGTDLENWNDSERVHRDSIRAGWNPVEIGDGVFPNLYPSYRVARELTGLPMGTLVKYTKDGVFDIEAYRASCIKRGLVPKV